MVGSMIWQLPMIPGALADESQGWTVLRFWNNEIDCNEETVLENILHRGEPPVTLS